MDRTSRIAAALLLAAALMAAAGAAPAAAQRNDGIDNSPSDQRIADDLRATGSKCGAPACGNNADGVYPPSTGPGYGSKSQSISAGQKQPDN